MINLFMPLVFHRALALARNGAGMARATSGLARCKRSARSASRAFL